MSLPPQVETDGLRAYEQVCAFEGMLRQRLPLIYGGLTLFFAIGGGAMLAWDYPYPALTMLVVAILFPVLTGMQWRRLRARYAANLRLLAELESRYGNALPWLRMEQHFAALEQLQADLAQEKRRKEEADRGPAER